MRMVYFPSEKCEIIDTWNVMGMRGTGSNDISVTDVYVPKSRTFPMVPDFEPGSHYRGPLYRFPLVGAAAAGIPTPMLGVARRALDEVTELARNKTPVASSGSAEERASAQVQLGRAEAILRSGRLLLLDSLSEAWRRRVDGETHSLEQKADLLLGMAHAMSSAVQAVEPPAASRERRRFEPPTRWSVASGMCRRCDITSSPLSNAMGPSGRCTSGFHRTSPWLPSSAATSSHALATTVVGLSKLQSCRLYGFRQSHDVNFRYRTSLTRRVHGIRPGRLHLILDGRPGRHDTARSIRAMGHATVLEAPSVQVL